MDSQNAMPCPLCKSTDAKNILNLNCGNFDNSALYLNAVIQACCACGHVYNSLGSNDVKKLAQYYNAEYTPVNMSSLHKKGSTPGGSGCLENQRYQQLFETLEPYINKKTRVLDVGCAMGGFLDFLSQKGLERLSGIDLSEGFLNRANRNGKYDVKHGSAQSIPFCDNSFDILVVNQVMEHLASPTTALKEAKRVLVNNGLLFIGVPDALRYQNSSPFDFYWFLIRDHIQHFDMEHLSMLAASEGFESISHTTHDHLALSEEVTMPSLNVVFRSTNQYMSQHKYASYHHLSSKIKAYISNSFDKLHHTKKLIDRLVQTQDPLYVWGIGSEFLYLYANTSLRKCNLSGLIDVNTHKQASFTVEGRSISPPSILTDATCNAKLIITAIAYKKALKKALNEMPYRGEILEI